MLNSQNIIALRIHRQHLARKANIQEYDSLFRYMSPVPTMYWTAPGEAPLISHRANFDDLEYNKNRRANREIIKGRFRNGGIGYVCFDEIELYAGLYRRNNIKLTYAQSQMLELIQREGPLTIRLIKEMTGMMVKRITPILHKLQQAFLVYEDQTDNQGDRSWYFMPSEFPDVDMNKYSRHTALIKVLPRFAHLCVAFHEDMAKSFYAIPRKEIRLAIDELVQRGELILTMFGYMLKKDYDLLCARDIRIPSNSVFLLHRNDFLVRANEYVLKHEFYSSRFDILHYILIDGEFRGAVMGAFKFGPNVIEDLVLNMSEMEMSMRLIEIIGAVYSIYDCNESPILRICGAPL